MKALPAPDDDEGKRHGTSTALAVRRELPVQSARRRSGTSRGSSAGEEVYDHRPRPISIRSRGHVRRGGHKSEEKSAESSEKGAVAAAVLFMLSLVICCSGGDD